MFPSGLWHLTNAMHCSCPGYKLDFPKGPFQTQIFCDLESTGCFWHGYCQEVISLKLWILLYYQLAVLLWETQMCTQDRKTLTCTLIFPRNTLTNLYQIYALSEVIILHNDQHQHQHQKTISANSRINSNIYQQLTPFVNWCYSGREVLFEKVCLFVAYKFVLHGKQFLAKQIRGME